MMVRRRWKRKEGHTSQNSGYSGRLAYVRGDVVGCEGLHGQGGESEVEKGGVGVFGVIFQMSEGWVGGVRGVLFAGGDEAEEPGLV